LEHSDYTLTSPLASATQAGGPLLCLTIVWHPDTSRIGEQCMVGDTLGVSRYLPLFHRPGQALAGLGYGGISRESVLIKRDQQGNLEIHPPGSRMTVELNGVEVYEMVSLRHEQIAAGAILGLGRAVLLCIHWMRCLPKNNPLPGLLGVGDAAIRMRELVRQVAATDDTVLLLGETGTGKEVVARAIHAYSARAARALVTVNMAALNESLAAADLFGAARGAYTGALGTRGGLFAEASQATLFLDEIGNAPVSVQPMLLRVLETGDYRPLGAAADLRSSARLIAATDQDLYAETFNQALLRRLESFVIHLPPLRERREDIGVLLLHLLGERPAGPAFTPQLASKFANYDWPGNVRQLRHVARRCLLALRAGESPDFDSLVEERPGRVTASAVQGEALPATAPPRRRKLAELSDADVLDALDNNGWYIQGAARHLGISRPSMYRLIDANAQIRAAGAIPVPEIAAALAQSGDDLEACAALLKTPSEALRRHLRALQLGPHLPAADAADQPL
jgi:transcriptional regulator with AAA-type ATPase domain